VYFVHYFVGQRYCRIKTDLIVYLKMICTCLYLYSSLSSHFWSYSGLTLLSRGRRFRGKFPGHRGSCSGFYNWQAKDKRRSKCRDRGHQSFAERKECSSRDSFWDQGVSSIGGTRQGGSERSLVHLCECHLHTTTFHGSGKNFDYTNNMLLDLQSVIAN